MLMLNTKLALIFQCCNINCALNHDLKNENNVLKPFTDNTFSIELY